MASPQTIALIIPTLNEAKNIVKLINAYQALPYSWHIIIADSNSPDGTTQEVQKAFTNTPNITILNCAKRGRGASIIHAYRWIIEHNLAASHVAISDADFSHDPRDFSTMVKALDQADIVIGSRYTKTSQIIGWPIGRRIFSRTANTFAALLLHIGIHDYTNGYRLFTINALHKLDLRTIDADGFIHLSQELIQWHQHSLTITEVSTTFVNRQRGKSNFNLKLIVESFQVIFQLATTYRRNKTNNN